MLPGILRKVVPLFEALALMAVPVTGVSAENDESGDGSISSSDLDFCLDASSFFKAKGETREARDVSVDSLESRLRANVSALAEVYRQHPDAVGFARSVENPVVPVARSEVRAVDAGLRSARSAGGDELRVEPEADAGFVSVAQLCQRFVKAKRLAEQHRVYMFYRINTETQMLDVEMEEPAPAAILDALQSDALINVTYSEPFELLGNRYDDRPPFAGGGLPTYNGDRCSLGFKVQNIDSGQNYMTIAGHSAILGSRWYYGNKYVGYAVTNYMQQAPFNLDIAMLTGANYSHTIFRGNGSSYASVIGSLPGGGIVGANIGISAGKSNREFVGTYKGVTHDETSNTAGCAWLAGVNYCNLRTVIIANGDTLKGGDSGSPVFAYTNSSSQVYALGTVTGFRASRSKIYYTDIEALLNTTHSRIATS
ncbi:chymotrypsin family serine protease [Mobiluncus mulieris]|uniref:hypothetical protein n=1 Tax=Mobiluncus mulieris TaxID=2052 RepID=UPI00019F8F34|nr:hypothetical protein [Mobiluncus mulieris]EEJ52988.1 hypothetical protein HMPREF0577_1999 [Mobiluncus mulieris ATCC 35243]MCU9971812.1 hypothetical protein [Mobiluncus mulieris]MCU9975034.1 hypothetical protein [Mobiluncus mulieris]MCV0001998.1 hypothetical protein [Mobiluncus mulieris]NMW91589.1 hypothetical protein [Mobiluncus mulieris]